MNLNQLHSYYDGLFRSVFILAFLKLQSKVDNIGMYHAIAKDIDEYNGGSDLMWNMAQYVERKPKKFCVSMCMMYITVSDALNLCTVIKMYCARMLVFPLISYAENYVWMCLFHRKYCWSTMRSTHTSTLSMI